MSEIKLKLKKSREKYQYLFENSPYSIILLNMEGKIEDCNITTEKLFGYKKSKLIGKICSQLGIFSEKYLSLFLESLNSLIKRGITKPIEIQLKNERGDLIWVQINSILMKLGDETLIQTIIQDISGRKQMEKELLESKQQLSGIVDSTPDRMSIIDVKYNILWVNDVAKQLFGPDLIGKKCYMAYHGRDKRCASCCVARTLKDGKIHEHETEVFEIDGKQKVFWCICNVVAYNKDRQPRLVMQISRDITDRKRMEEALKKSEKEKSIILESISELIAFQDMNHTILWANKAAGDSVNLSPEQLIGHKCYEIWQNRGEPCVNCPITITLKTNQQTTKEITTPDGRIWNISGYPVYDDEGNIIGVVEVTQNITERKKAEETLRQGELRFRKLFETMAEGVVLINQDGQIIQANTAAERILGLKRPDIEQRNYISPQWEILRTDGTPMPANEMAGPRAMKEKQLVENIVMGVKRPDDTISWINVSAAPLMDETGKLFGIVGTFSDITERKKTEEALQKKSEEQALLLDNIETQIWYAVDIETYGAVNRARAEFLGLEKSALEGKKLYDIMSKEEAEVCIAGNRKVFEEKRQIRTEEWAKNSEGEMRLFSVIKTPKLDDNGNVEYVVCTAEDITDRKRLEVELKEISQLKSDLLKRTSHELKTPLISIKGFAELLLNLYYEKFDADTISILNEINQGCVRLENIITNLLKSSHLESGQVDLNPSKENLSFLIKFCVNELRGLAKVRNQSIFLGIHDNIFAEIEKEKIHEVVINLLTNAIKNTPPGGVIKIQSEIKEDFIIISIEDNGIGITEEEKKRLFKQFGKIERYGQGWDVGIEGTGLGLYISKKMIELHGGKIWVESEGRNKGSTFYFSLPIIKD